MNVALIYTENDIWAFGIRSISASLKQAGHNTKIIIVNNIGDALVKQSVLEKIEKITNDCTIIGVGSFSPGSDKAKQICKYLKGKHNGRIIVWGGLHATMNPAECTQHADIVCVGEGEDFIVELAACIQEKRSWRHLQNAVFLDNDRLVKNDVRPLIKDLDTLPPFDLSFENEFHLREGSLVRVEKIDDAAIPIMFNGTRGCAFSCKYCSNSQIKNIYKGKGRYVRKLSPEKYIQILENIRIKFPSSKYFNLVDEDFFAYSIEEIQRFAELYKERIRIPFECMGSPRNAIKEKIEPLSQAGLWRVNMGVESGSERTKKEIYNRHITNKEVIQASRVLAGFKNIILNCFIIIGNPYERNADLLQTVELFNQMAAPFFLTIYNLIFFPGTPLYRMAVGDKIISGYDDSGYEMNFLSGFKYKEHQWKNRNLYMNGLIYLMMGKVTSLRMGLIPRGVSSFITKPAVITFNERHPTAIKTLIFAKRRIWRLRSALIQFVKRWLPNPAMLNKKASDAFRLRFNQPN